MTEANEEQTKVRMKKKRKEWNIKNEEKTVA